ncbi:hypothetical protein [Salinibius halmophilus]|uniref:hypothetical protein n=1 Tax=Salinibius halmophilus TaxID=1853216 RepID=UPI000E6759B0|nr:hypothetical protein [Salinibius halmophilus]
MRFPTIIAFESVNDENPIPTAIAWTLPDGQYKSVLVKPAETWREDIEEHGVAFGRAVEELDDLGENIVDIARELTHDLGDETVYSDQPDEAQACLEKLFETVVQECPWEVTGMPELFGDWQREEYEDVRREEVDALALNLSTAEERLLVDRSMVARHLNPLPNTADWYLDDE